MIHSAPCAHPTAGERRNRLLSIDRWLIDRWLTALYQIGYQVGRAGLGWLSRRSELQVWQRGNCVHPHWRAFDPKTGQSFSSPSDAEMRHWIEQRYQ